MKICTNSRTLVLFSWKSLTNKPKNPPHIPAIESPRPGFCCKCLTNKPTRNNVSLHSKAWGPTDQDGSRWTAGTFRLSIALTVQFRKTGKHCYGATRTRKRVIVVNQEDGSLGGSKHGTAVLTLQGTVAVWGRLDYGGSARLAVGRWRCKMLAIR